MNHVCDSMTPPQLAVAQNPDWLVGDAANLYWIDAGADIRSVGKSGGAVTTLSSQEAGPTALALDDGYVYWTARLGGAIRRVPKAGGPAEVVVSAVEPYYLAVDDAWVYWVDASRTIFRAHKAGSPGGQAIGAVSQLTPASFDVDPTYLYWFTEAQGLYWKAERGGLDGSGPPEDVASWEIGGPAYGFVRGKARTLTLGPFEISICRDDDPSNCLMLGAPSAVPGGHGVFDDGVFVFGAGNIVAFSWGGPGIAKALSCDGLFEPIAWTGTTSIVVDDNWVYYLDPSAVMRTPK